MTGFMISSNVVVTADRPNGASLRTFVAGLFDERDLLSNFEVGRRHAKHGILVEINLASVERLQKPMMRFWRKACDASMR